MFLSNLSIKRPVFAAVMMLALVTLGITSYLGLPVDLWPNVEIPVITIITVYPGASPEAVEREVSKRIEEAVNPIAGVKHLGSTSREGVSQIVVEFALEVSPDRAVQDARTKIAAIRGDLPATIQDPIIEKLDIGGAPVVSLAVRSSSLAPRDLTTLVDKKIKRRLENVSGVGKIDLIGAVKREVGIEVTPERLEALGMGVEDVVYGLRSANIDTPLGRVNGAGREIPVRVQGKARKVDQFDSMVIAQRSGRPVRLGEVADVRDGIEEVRSLALVNGIPAVALDVLKQTGANAVGLADAIKKEVAVIQKDLPAGTAIEIVRDGSVFIRESVADVQQTLLLGGLLTVLIVFFFLNSWRSTVITGLTLPISVISSFIVMNFAGMTLNVMTLMGLSLAIGLLIDDAIVVRENIVRHLERGEDHLTAAKNGTSEIGLAVIATTFSIVAVFVPVAFMKGIIGRFFFAFGITVTFAVLVSLFVSFTLDPMLSSRWVDPDIERTGRRNPVARLLDRFNAWFDRTADRYRGVIGWALDHRLTVAGLAFGAFVIGIGAMGLLEKEFMPATDKGEFLAFFKTAPGASIDETKDRMRAALDSLSKVPEIQQTYGSIGAGDAGTVRDARLYLKLSDRGARTRSQREIERDVRARLLAISGIIPSLAQADSMDSRKPLIVGVRGEDIARLKQYSRRLEDALYRVPGIVDLEASLEHEAPEYRLNVDQERAADAGLSNGMIAAAVGVLVGGEAVTTFEDEEGEARNVRVRLAADRRLDASQIEGLRLAVPRMTSPMGRPALIPLASVARYELSTTPSEINRMDLSREVTVSGNLDGLPLGTAVDSVRKASAGLDLAPGYRVVISGESDTMDESFGYMGQALLLALVFVYLILAAQFESFIDPLSIMLSLPLSIVGMAAMLLVTGDTFNVMSMIGLIMLMGLVTKNAILLIDYAKVLRGRGLDRREAIIEAGRTRLRPILMTTSAMIFGMLPLALALGSGAELRAPMARAVIGGLITSTLLTLVVVPVVYTLLEDAMAWASRRRDALAPVASAAGSAVLVLALVLGPGAASPAMAQAGAADRSSVEVRKSALREAQGAVKVSNGEGPKVRKSEPVLVLTLDEALAIAAEQNRDVLKATEYRNWAQGKYVEERASALPQVVFSGNVLRTFDDSQSKLYRNLPGMGATGLGDVFGGRQDIGVAELKIAQPIFTWGQVGAAVRAAQGGFRLADDQLRLSRQAVVREVATAFYDVLAAKELAAIAQQDYEQKERHLEEAKRRQAAGTATDYDVLASQVALENARPGVIRGNNAVTVAKARLRFLLGEDGEVDVTGMLATPVEPAPSYETVYQSALGRRPELSALSSQRGIYREIAAIAKSGNRPRLDFVGGVGTRTLGLKYLSATGTTWNAGVVATIPLFDGNRTRGRVAQAESDLSRIALDELRLRDQVALEVRTALAAVQEAAEIVTASAGTVKQAERLLFLAEKGFELGVNTRLEVQDAELNRLAARGNLARAQRDYRVARMTLDWVAGTADRGAATPVEPK